MASVQLKNVVKKYPNGFVAVKDFNLEIEDKEFIIFVGPSGCGKSTTLRMVAGLEDISSGDLFIDGKRMNDVEPKDRDIAMVFQNYALYPHMTVYDNMAFGLKLRKVPKDEIDKKVHEAARILGYGKWSCFFRILFPQVWKNILPSITNEVITLVKDTSLAFSISVMEMFTQAKALSSSQSSMFPLIMAGVLYYIFNFVVAFIMEQMEKKMAYYQ